MGSRQPTWKCWRVRRRMIEFPGNGDVGCAGGGLHADRPFDKAARSAVRKSTRSVNEKPAHNTKE
jgi:hypothetical protein